jgi:cell division septum initiation protein DivIVA
MNNNNPTAEVQLPEDIKQRIENDAEFFANVEIGSKDKISVPAVINQWEQTKADYEAGATAWAIWKERYDILVADVDHQENKISQYEDALEKLHAERYETRLAIRMLLKVFKNDQISKDQERYYSQAEAVLEIIKQGKANESGATDLQAKYDELQKEVEYLREWKTAFAKENDELKEKAEKMEAALKEFAGYYDPSRNYVLVATATVKRGKEYPKLTTEQITDRQAAIDWYRNPSGEKEVESKSYIVFPNNSDAFRNWAVDVKGYGIALLGHQTGVILPAGETYESFQAEWEVYERANNPNKKTAEGYINPIDESY